MPGAMGNPRCQCQTSSSSSAATASSAALRRSRAPCPSTSRLHRPSVQLTAKRGNSKSTAGPPPQPDLPPTQPALERPIPTPSSAAHTNPSTSQPEADADNYIEAEFQEQEVDLTVEDLTALQYEVSEEDLDDLDEGDEGEQDTSSGPTPSAQLPHGEEERDSASDVDQRRAAILLELLASGSGLETKLAELGEYVDLEMLSILERRIETARRRNPNGEVTPDMQHTVDLYRALKHMYQRNQASPAMRLLDDVLAILGDGDEDPSSMGAAASAFDTLVQGSLAQATSERRRDAAACMQTAFTGGIAGGVDVFAAAARLAEAGPLAADELSEEYVGLHDFLAETTELLDQAQQQQAALEQSLARAQEEVDYVQETEPERAVQDPMVADVMRQLVLGRQVHEGRRRSIVLLEEAVYIARTLEREPLREGGMMRL